MVIYPSGVIRIAPLPVVVRTLMLPESSSGWCRREDESIPRWWIGKSSLWDSLGTRSGRLHGWFCILLGYWGICGLSCRGLVRRRKWHALFDCMSIKVGVNPASATLPRFGHQNACNRVLRWFKRYSGSRLGCRFINIWSFGARLVVV